jgi:hypothetical protein
LIAPGGHLIERAPIEIAAITMTTRRQRQLTPSLEFVLTEHVAFVLIYRGGRQRVSGRTKKRPRRATAQPAQPRQNRSVRWPQGGTSDLTAQDGNLVPEHDDLDDQVLLPTA